MPQMTWSTGRSFVTSVRRAEEPAAISTISPSPAPTASTATTWLPAGWNLPSTSRASSSFNPESPASLRVLTTVPSTFARIIAGPLALVRRGLGPPDRQRVLELRVRAWDDVHRDHVADLRSRSRSGFGGRAHRGDVAAHHGGHVAAADLLVVDQGHACGLHHGVRGLDHGDEAPRLDQAQRFFHRNLRSTVQGADVRRVRITDSSSAAGAGMTCPCRKSPIAAAAAEPA